jgi:DNA-binding FadR family transcriptional regulator
MIGGPSVGKSKRPASDSGLRIHQAIARDIGTAILSGRHQPGDQMGIEVEQSTALNISRTAYREAIRILIAKGLPESRPKVGTHVTPRDRWNLLDPDVLAWMFSSKPDEIFVRDLFELRHILEPAAARLAALRRDDDQIARMREALRIMAMRGLKHAAGQAADQDFHKALLAATRNEALASLSSSVASAVRWTTHYKQKANPSPRNAVPDHEAVFAAIVAGDGETAGKAMKHLLDLAFMDMAAITEELDR